jgi:hypothetical protein
MTHKEATNILYQNISKVTIVETNGMYRIYKHNVENKYMVIKNDNEDCDISPIFTTIEQSREWSQ